MIEEILMKSWNWIIANIEKIGIILAIISGIGTIVGITKFFFSPITAFFAYCVEKRKKAERIRKQKLLERKNNRRGKTVIRKMVKK